MRPRRPARAVTVRAAVVVVAIAVLALSGCAAMQAPAPVNSTVPASPSESPIPDAGELEVAAVLVRADAVEFLDPSGETVDEGRVAYAEPIDAALARLTELLGEPATDTYEAFASGSGTLREWEGLVLDAFPEGMVGEQADAPTWGVRLEAASAGDLDLVAVGDLAVGDTAPDGLPTSACNSLMAEIVGGLGVEIEVDDAEATITGVRAPVFTDVCE
jgi:hypothetical protein